MAISQYAADHAIGGEDFDLFVTFMQGIEDEWAAVQLEKSKKPS